MNKRNVTLSRGRDKVVIVKPTLRDKVVKVDARKRRPPPDAGSVAVEAPPKPRPLAPAGVLCDVSPDIGQQKNGTDIQAEAERILTANRNLIWILATVQRDLWEGAPDRAKCFLDYQLGLLGLERKQES